MVLLLQILWQEVPVYSIVAARIVQMQVGSSHDSPPMKHGHDALTGGIGICHMGQCYPRFPTCSAWFPKP